MAQSTRGHRKGLGFHPMGSEKHKVLKRCKGQWGGWIAVGEGGE